MIELNPQDKLVLKEKDTSFKKAEANDLSKEEAKELIDEMVTVIEFEVH